MGYYAGFSRKDGPSPPPRQKVFFPKFCATIPPNCGRKGLGPSPFDNRIREDAASLSVAGRRLLASCGCLGTSEKMVFSRSSGYVIRPAL